MPIRRSEGGSRPLPSVAVIDVRLLRTDLDGVKKNLARRGIDLGQVDQAAALDSRLRELESERDDARRRINELSKQVGGLRRDARVDEAEALQRESRSLGDREQQLATEASGVDDQLRGLLLRIPNLISDEAPDGATEADNPVVRVVGYDADAYGEHQRVPHWEIGTQLGILDNERAVKISGAMFSMQRGLGLVDPGVAAQPAHLLRQLVDPPPGVVTFAHELAEPAVQRGGLVDLAEVDAAARQVLLHPVQVGSQQPDVDHADRR